MVEFGSSSTFRGWIMHKVRLLSYGLGVRAEKSIHVPLNDLVRAFQLPKVRVRDGWLKYITGIIKSRLQPG